MTDARDVARTLALRLILSMQSRDVESTNVALTDVRRAADTDPELSRLVMMELSGQAVAALNACGRHVDSDMLGVSVVSARLLAALDGP